MKNGKTSSVGPKWLPLGYVVAFILLALGIGAVGYFYLQAQIAKSRETTENELSSIAELKVKQISAWYKERLNHAGYFCDSRWFSSSLEKLESEPSNTKTQNEIINFIDSVRKNFGYSRVLIFNSGGKLIFSSPSDENWVGPTAVEAVSKALKSGEITVSDLHMSKVKAGFVNMDFLIPVRMEEDGKKKLYGVIMMEIDPKEFLFPIIQSWPTPSQSAETLLVRREGDEVIYLNELRHRKDTAVKLKFKIDSRKQLPAAMAALGKEGVIEGIDYRDVPVLADIRRIPGTPWFMVAKVDKEEIFAPVRSQSQITMLLILVLILATFLGVGFLWKRRDAEFLKKSHEELEKRVIERTAALNRSLQEISDLYNNAPCGYHSLDKDGKILMINDTELKWFGCSRYEAIGKKFLDFFTPKSKKIFLDEFPRFKERGWVKNLDFELICKDGSVLPVILNSTAIKDEEGNYLMSRSTIVDILERKRIEKELERLNRSLKFRSEELEAVNRELEAFSYSVSHDLKAPLRSVDGFARMLGEDYSDKLDDEGKRILQVIRDSAKDMGQLISDLLEFSRMSRKDLHGTIINMNELVKEVFTRLENDLKGRTVGLDAVSLPEIYGDPAMIKEVLVNLLSNAFKFTRPKKMAIIKVEARDEGDDIVFTISDNGVGFDMSYKDKLFCVFQRLHSSAEFEGTGIGLALVHRIIQRHGGRVWAESELGKGASFYFSLPGSEKNR